MPRKAGIGRIGNIIDPEAVFLDLDIRSQKFHSPGEAGNQRFNLHHLFSGIWTLCHEDSLGDWFWYIRAIFRAIWFGHDIAVAIQMPCRAGTDRDGTA